MRPAWTRNSLSAALAACAAVAALAGGAASATAPGANGAIVFERFATASGNDASSQLFRLQPDGSVRGLTTKRGGNFHPSWSPDAQHVVFENGIVAPGQRGRSHLYAIGADGTGLRSAASGCKGKCLGDVFGSYSPDGARIAFVRVIGPWVRRHYGKSGRTVLDFTTGEDLMVVASGGGRPKLVKHYGIDPQPWVGAPQWSPDGKSLVVALGSGKHPGAAQRLGTALFSVSIAGAKQREITSWKLGAATPSWSPDGSLIAFNSEGGHTPHIYVVRPNGSGLRDVLGPKPSGFPENPAWSPDGAQIAFDLGRGGDGQRGIYAMNADGSNVHALVDAPQMEVAPAWAPAR
ncbi:MAG: TolB family protein [Thermoleophilaceae bacterium]